MSNQFLGEIRLFAFPFAPKGWAQCNGQLLAIQQNQALFSLLGTTYGGNGVTTFGLPDVRGRHLNHVGQGYSQGQRAGEQAHTLTANEMPVHNHVANARAASADGTAPSTDVVWAVSTTALYGTVLPGPPKKDVVQGLMAPDALTNSGGNQPHDNQPPALVLNYCMALVGIFPSRN